MNILFFAQLREQLGCSELTLEIEHPVSIKAIKQQLVDSHPHWKPFFEETQLLNVKNQTLVDSLTLIDNSDELAFIPPVTGG